MKRVLQLLSYILVAAAASCTTLFLIGERSAYPKLAELGALVDEVFIGEVDHGAMEEAAAKAMVGALDDRWSYYMTAQEHADYEEQMNNAYVGIGVHITQREDGYISIVKVEETGPAAEAGILPGDVMTHVEGQDISAMDVDAIKNIVRGEEGTFVGITLLRDSVQLEVTVQRRSIQSIVAKSQMLDGGVGLVTIVNFDSRCAEETLAGIEQLLKQGAKGLIFDVRFNPGGYKKELVRILDYLLPEGPLFRSVDYEGKERVDMSDAECLNIPMAVLVNGDSYSAAEFFAAALREYEAAKLIGQPTTGKGHFQSKFTLSDGSAAVISIGKYCTPNGNSLADEGLTPDILVEVDEQTYAKIYYGALEPADDPQIQAAVTVLLNWE